MSASTRVLCSATVALLAISSPAIALFDNVPAWVSIGATGTPDEADAHKVAFDNDGSVRIKSSISGTSAKLRFNVTTTREITSPNPPVPPGEIGDGDFLKFSVVFQDNGPQARVVAKLIRINIDGSHDPVVGSEVLATVDTDRFPDGQDFRRGSATMRSRGQVVQVLGFRASAYIVEVQLIKNGPGGDPRVKAVIIDRDF